MRSTSTLEDEESLVYLKTTCSLHHYTGNRHTFECTFRKVFIDGISEELSFI